MPKENLLERFTPKQADRLFGFIRSSIVAEEADTKLRTTPKSIRLYAFAKHDGKGTNIPLTEASVCAFKHVAFQMFLRCRELGVEQAAKDAVEVKKTPIPKAFEEAFK